MNLRQAYADRNEDVIRQYCRERYDVDPAEYGVQIFRKPMNEYAPQTYAARLQQANSICVDTWLRSQLHDRVPLPGFNSRRDEMPDITLGTKLHCFFLAMDETPEMLRLLRANKTELVTMFLLARSRLPRSLYYVRPIDATAGRVLECDRQEGA